MVQLCCLGAGVLADYQPVDLEPAAGVGPSPAHLTGQASATDLVSPVQGYGPAEVATTWKAGRFSGRDFAFQPDGTLCCPAGQKLTAHERRREADGSLRVVYAASIRSCRPCPLR